MEDNGMKTWYDGSMKKGKDPRGGLRRGFSFSRLLRFYEVRLLTDGLRWRHLSLREERYRRKTRLVVASSTSFVLPLVAKAQSLRCSSSPHRTHFVGLRRGPCFKAALWNPLLYGGMRGDVRSLHVFAVMQFTRFRPVRGVLRTDSTDSCLLHVVRRFRDTY